MNKADFIKLIKQIGDKSNTLTVGSLARHIHVLKTMQGASNE